ncbi:hypothetical protein H4R34_004044 [Dimargaris verticillata]|uniref:Peptidase S8/S53 domain-containing protein n=1 Tax=Dimargaris verticillata TaxID=2761393 RepID=A0A9W8AZP8_9FUNG|nr:hypothetical protein H4R34_004044 [Dimargaris verticillata]
MRVSYGALWALATGLAMTALMVQAGPATNGAYLGRRQAGTPTELAPKPMLMHGMTGVDEAHKMGFTGKGIKIGMVGGGLYYHHPALGGSCYGQADCKVVGGYDFVGENYDFNDPSSKPEPDDDPYEVCEGTTTFQAGVLAGKADSFLGVAPDAQLSVYRVFSCASPVATKPSLVIDAMQKAYDDGCNIIYVNLGTYPGVQSDQSAQLADKFAKSGVVVVTSAGFYGDKTLFRVHAPGAGLSVISSIAADSDRKYMLQLTVQAGNEKFMVERTGAANNMPEFKVDNAPVTYFDQDATLLQGCQRTQTDFKKSLVLIARGDCTFTEKLANAAAQGASGVIFFNNVHDAIPALSISSPQPIPATMVSKAEGEKLLALLKAAGNGGSVTVSANTDLVEAKVATGGQPSALASQGRSNDLEVKPELLVPGTYFYSSTTPSRGIYEAWADSKSDGAYLAGCVALLMQAGIPRDPYHIRRMLMAYAVPRTNAKGDKAVSVALQGAGMINLTRLLQSTVELSATKFTLLDPKYGGFVDGKVMKTFNITNYGSQSVTYELTTLPADSVTNIKQQQLTYTTFTDGQADVKYSLCEVTVEAGASVEVRVQITEPSYAQYPNVVYSGYIQAFIKGQAKKQSQPAWSFPYLGLNTDFDKLPMFAPTSQWANPGVYRSSTQGHVAEANKEVFTMKDGDIPGIYLKHQFPLGFTAVYLSTVQNPTVPYAYARLPSYGWDRTSVETGAFTKFYMSFNQFYDSSGKVVTVPNGQYVATFAYGSPFERDYAKVNWLYWTSPAFEIKLA